MQSLERFRGAVAARIESHPVVSGNHYTRWFSLGTATPAELRHFTVQFSVFSHLFIEAQLRKCINAADLQAYRAGKEILLNELGVTFTKQGSVNGGRFSFNAAHFEWLAAFAAELGLAFDEIGKPQHATPSTRRFCDALMRWYASPDRSASTGASYAIEHWAAAGFWKQLITGLQTIRATRLPNLPLGFWVWHDRLEETHAAHTDDELALAYADRSFDEGAFLEAGTAMLDAVQTFWDGLARERLSDAETLPNRLRAG